MNTPRNVKAWEGRAVVLIGGTGSAGVNVAKLAGMLGVVEVPNRSGVYFRVSERRCFWVPWSWIEPKEPAP